MIELSEEAGKLMSQALVFLGITLFNVLFFSALYFRFKRNYIKTSKEGLKEKLPVNSRKAEAKKKTAVVSIEDMSQSLHDSALAIVTMIAPWLVPVVNAYLIGHAVRVLLEWPVPVAILTGIAVEMVGIQCVTLTLKIFDYEQVRGKKSTSITLVAKNRGDASLKWHLILGLALSIIYFGVLVFMTYVLEIYPDSSKYAALGMIGLTVASVVSIALKSSAQAAFNERDLRLEEVADDKRVADEEKARVAAEKVAAASAIPVAKGDGISVAVYDDEQSQQQEIIAVGQSGVMQNSDAHSTEIDATNNGASNNANWKKAALTSQNGNSAAVQTPALTSQNGNGMQQELMAVTSQIGSLHVGKTTIDANGNANGNANGSVRVAPEITYAQLKGNQRKLVDLLRSEFLTQDELAEEIGCNRSTIYRNISKLQELGAIEAYEYTGSRKTGNKKVDWYKVLI